jgi:hypothetical protein
VTEQELLSDCLARLNRIGLIYYLTGSMASNYWGIPRSTHDLDFVMQIPASAVRALVDAFSGDYYIDEAAVVAAYRPPYQFNAIDTRSALKVDFWLAQETPFHQEMLRRRLGTTLFGEMAWIATAEDVILHKLVWNAQTPSERQLSDAAGVVSVQRSKLDEGYLRKWAEDLEVLPILNELLIGRIRPKHT